MTKLEEIKKILFGTETPEVTPEVTVEPKFVDIKSGDILIRVDGEVAVDATVAIVTIVDEVETIEVIEDGEYKYADGILVIESSIIKEIKEVEVEPETVETTETAMSVETKPEVNETEVKFEAMEESTKLKFETLENSIVELTKLVVELSAQPGAPEVKVKKSTFSLELEKQSGMKDDKLKSLGKFLSKK